VPMITCCSRGSLLRPGFAILLICHFDNGCANLADRSSSSRQNFFMSPSCSDREGTWTNAFGEQIRFPLVIESAMGALERATRKLNDAMANQSSERVSDLVHEFACSGTHLVYGLATCLRAGWLEPEFSERMKSQINILIPRSRSPIPNRRDGKALSEAFFFWSGGTEQQFFGWFSLHSSEHLPSGERRGRECRHSLDLAEIVWQRH
jgi:hypothetical protein